MTESILDEAARLVSEDRQADYGTPAENHSRTAALWSAFLGVDVTPRQVCMLNALQKLSREAHAPKRDNLVDVAGYMLNAELVTPRPLAPRGWKPPCSRCEVKPSTVLVDEEGLYVCGPCLDAEDLVPSKEADESQRAAVEALREEFGTCERCRAPVVGARVCASC